MSPCLPSFLAVDSGFPVPPSLCLDLALAQKSSGWSNAGALGLLGLGPEGGAEAVHLGTLQHARQLVEPQATRRRVWGMGQSEITRMWTAGFGPFQKPGLAPFLGYPIFDPHPLSGDLKTGAIDSGRQESG